MPNILLMEDLIHNNHLNWKGAVFLKWSFKDRLDLPKSILKVCRFNLLSELEEEGFMKQKAEGALYCFSEY